MKLMLALLLAVISLQLSAKDGFLDKYKNLNNNKEQQLLVFYKPDCPYCINMDKALSADENFQQALTKKYSIRVLDITSAEGRMIADKFDVHAVPTIICYNNRTGDIQRIKGFGSIEKLAVKLDLSFTVVTKTAVNSISGVCGDGHVDAGEQCDDGNIVNGDGCDANCTITACGNGIVTSGESCDDGNTVSGDGCDNNCTITACGNGIVTSGESCDDGNTVNGDGCSATCQFEAPGNDDCSGAFAIVAVSGVIIADNSAATLSVGPAPGCQSAIAHDLWYKFTLASSKFCHFKVTGPGVDDPVLTLYSGTCAALAQIACSDDITPATNLFSQVESALSAGTYYVRVASYNGSTYGLFSLEYNLNSSSVCGNGIVESGEECDDANTGNGDGCSSVCKFENTAAIKGVSINTDSTRSDPSAMLDVKSFGKGILIPRMNTTQRTTIPQPAKGLFVFDITTNTFWYHNGTVWAEVGGTSGTAGSGLPTGAASQTLRSNGTNWISNSVLQNDGTNVTVTGQLKISGGTPGLNKVLTSDATGLGTWISPSFDSLKTTGFTATNSSVGITGSLTPTLPNENFDDGNNFASSVYTVPSTGLYHFISSALFNFSSVANQTTVRLIIETVSGIILADNGVILPLGYTSSTSLESNGIAKLTAGTQVRIRIFVAGSGMGAQVITTIKMEGFKIY
ncbi:MAG: DUF4215 domain-containing protein [Ferruginibacter sp.]